MNSTQSVGIYANALAGHLVVTLNGYLLFDDVKKGHSFSSCANPWLVPGENKLTVSFAPPHPFTDPDQVAVSAYIHESVKTIADQTLLAEAPEAAIPVEEILTPGPTRDTFSKVERTYLFDLAKAQVGDWLQTPKPWEHQRCESPGYPDLISFYLALEKCFVSKDSDTVIKLAKDKIRFTAAVMQKEEELFQNTFVDQLTKVMNSPAGIKTCTAPDVELEFFPVKRNLVHRIRWASGMGTVRTKADANGFQQGFDVICARSGGLWHWVW